MYWCIFWHMLLKLHCGGHSNLKIKFAKANKIANLAKSIEETELNSSSFVLFILGDNHCYSYKTMTSSSSMHSSNSDKLGYLCWTISQYTSQSQCKYNTFEHPIITKFNTEKCTSFDYCFQEEKNSYELFMCYIKGNTSTEAILKTPRHCVKSVKQNCSVI